MPLLTITDLSIGFRGPDLLDGVSAVVEHGQRIGLLGRNGAGKTTLMRMLCGVVTPDHGSIIFEDGARVAFLRQDVPQDMQGKIADIVAKGLTESHPVDGAQENEEPIPEWECQNRVETILTRMNLNGDADFMSLSSGMKRRVLLAKALISNPDLLLLDEPTNHLDVESIEWLESFLNNWKGALIFVTHDRAFLQKLATRILEIDRGQLFDWSCDYQTFLKRKEQAIEAQEKQDALFDKKLAEEEVWIRQGIKARRTRNMGRVRSLIKLREERAARYSKTGTSNLQIQEAQRSGNLVIEAKDISFSYGDQILFQEFSTTIMRGDKVGLIGPNGAGKTTLLKILLGELKSHSGKVKLGSNLQVAYFDQLRQQLDESKTVQQDVGEGADFVMINGVKKHVIGYLQDFLFAPERSRTQIKFLSGGERNRILLAKLFAKPANVIVLDEPTNDLDSETLELLEEKLIEFQGTILLVSHDRAFLNNVVTSSIVFEKESDEGDSSEQSHRYQIKEYVGGYDDWVRQRKPIGNSAEPKSKKPKTGNIKNIGQPNSAATSTQPATRKLKFKEKQELESLPEKIEGFEQAIAKIHEQMADPKFFQQDGATIARIQKELEEIQQKLETSFARWEELEAFEQ